MAKVHLYNPKYDPWTHVSLPELDDNGEPVKDEQGNIVYKEFHAGDIIEVDALTAEHLIMSQQGELQDEKE